MEKVRGKDEAIGAHAAGSSVVDDAPKGLTLFGRLVWRRQFARPESRMRVELGVVNGKTLAEDLDLAINELRPIFEQRYPIVHSGPHKAHWEPATLRPEHYTPPKEKQFKVGDRVRVGANPPWFARNRDSINGQPGTVSEVFAPPDGHNQYLVKLDHLGYSLWFTVAELVENNDGKIPAKEPMKPATFDGRVLLGRRVNIIETKAGFTLWRGTGVVTVYNMVTNRFGVKLDGEDNANVVWRADQLHVVEDKSS